jgi:hypothetical protein
MSRENAEAVRCALERFPQDPDQLRAWLPDFWEPDADYYPVRKWPESRPCHGIEEIERFMARFIAAWDHWEMEALEVTAVGTTCVLARESVVAEGRGSGLALNGDLYQCSWMRRGRYLRVEDHLTLDGAVGALGVDAEALEAVGVRK